MLQGVESYVQKKKIEGSWEIEKLLSVLNKLTDFDHFIEKKIKRYGWGAILLYIPAVVGFIGSFFIYEEFDLIPIWFFAGLGVLGVLGFVFLLLYFKNRNLDLSNGFRLLVAPLLQDLKDDIKAGTKIEVKIPLSEIEERINLKNISPPYSKGAYHRIVDHDYQRDFMWLSMRLQDGNKLTLKGNEFLKVIEKTKRNPRGKTKSKTKYKKLFTFDFMVKLNEKFQTDPELPQHTKFPGKFYNKKTAKGTVLGTRFVLKRKERDSYPESSTLTVALLDLYRSVKVKGGK